MQVTQVTGDDPRIRPLLEAHVAFCAATAPAESCHYLPPETVAADPDLLIWAAFDDETAAAIGGLRITGTEGEIKSMHTAAAYRGRGAARMILDTILQTARDRSLSCVQLETGAMADFAPARALYEAAGFTTCAPFGSYTEDPLSTFYHLDLCAEEATV